MKNTHIIALCVGCIIGWGAFILPQDLFLSKAGFTESVFGLLLGAIAICIIASNYSFLLYRFGGGSGGEFYFALKALGRNHGFICGWFLSLAYLCIIPLNSTALNIAWHSFGMENGGILYRFLDMPIYVADLIISTVSIMCVGVVQILGMRAAMLLQQILTLLLSLSVVVFFVAMACTPISWQNLATYFSPHEFKLSAVFVVFALAPWAYLGFDCAVQLAESRHNKFNTFTIFMYISIAIGFVLYVMLICITAFGIPQPQLANAIWATKESIVLYFGDFGNILLHVGIFGAIFSGMNGFFIATEKLFQSLARHKFLPKFFMRKNRFGSHYNIVLFVAFLSCFLASFGRSSLLYIVDTACFGIIVGFLYVSIIALRLQGKFHILSFSSIILSVVFLSLEFLPFSPAALKPPSLIMLLCWAILGVMLLIIGKNITHKSPPSPKAAI